MGMQNNEAIVMAAMLQDRNAFQYAADEMKNKVTIATLARVQQDGKALQHASEEMKNNEAIVMAAIQQNWNALEYVTRKVGIRLQARPGKELQPNGDDYYSDGDCGTIEKYENAADRFCIRWNRTGKSSSMTKAQWGNYFKFLSLGPLQHASVGMQNNEAI